MEERLKDYLHKFSINYKMHKHPAVFTVAESKNHPLIKNIPGLRTKSLFLKDEDNKFYLVCLPGEKRLDIKGLKNQIGKKEIHFANPEELKSELNLTPGSVSIFGMINSSITTLIIDNEVWKAEIVGFHPNINTSTLEINHSELEKFLHSLKCKSMILDL